MSTEFKVDAKGFIDAIRDALVFAGTDDTLPQITGVAFHLRPGWLYLSATDRYVLGQLRLRVDSTVSADFMLQRTELTRLTRYFKPTERGSKPVLDVGVGKTAITIEESGAVPGLLGVRASFLLSTAKAVPTDVLTDKSALAVEGYVAAFNPQFMAKFARVQRDRDAMIMTPTGNRNTTFITIGDYFRGLIMPVRVSTGADVLGEPWPAFDAPVAVDPPVVAKPSRRKKAAA